MKSQHTIRAGWYLSTQVRYQTRGGRIYHELEFICPICGMPRPCFMWGHVNVSAGKTWLLNPNFAWGGLSVVQVPGLTLSDEHQQHHRHPCRGRVSITHQNRWLHPQLFTPAESASVRVDAPWQGGKMHKQLVSGVGKMCTDTCDASKPKRPRFSIKSKNCQSNSPARLNTMSCERPHLSCRGHEGGGVWCFWQYHRNNNKI